MAIRIPHGRIPLGLVLALGAACTAGDGGDAKTEGTAAAPEPPSALAPAPPSPAAPPSAPASGAGSPCSALREIVCGVAGADSEVCKRTTVVAPHMKEDECIRALAAVEERLRAEAGHPATGAPTPTTSSELGAAPLPGAPPGLPPPGAGPPSAAAASMATGDTVDGPCAVLVRRLCNDVGVETESCALMRQKVGVLAADNCVQMLNGYEQVIFEVRRRDLANRPIDAATWAAMIGGDAPSFGPRDAKVTVVEFSDFECSACAEIAKVVGTVKAAGRARFVFRQFPLEQHEQARLAAVASLAANAQGRFWDFHDALYAAQDHIDRAGLDILAQGAGLDVTAFWRAIDGGTLDAIVDADIALGERLGLAGTPTFFINGERITDFGSVEALSAAIERAAGKAQ